MTNREKSENIHPTVTEAVETLSSIAEMDFDREIALATNEIEEIILPLDTAPEVPLKTIQWLYEQPPEDRIEIIKEVFKVILNYLKSFYKKQFRYLPNQKDSEGVKAIMVLVGEAAKKLDKHKEFFENCKLKTITELSEYKKLQEFYLSRIARKIDEGTLSKWILGLSRRLIETQEKIPSIATTKHVFVDLDSVKKDIEYELFFIRKEDGSRFFSPQIIRNIKLVCDFGERLSEIELDDPLENVKLWRNWIVSQCAKDILHASQPEIRKYYQETANIEEEDFRKCLGKAVMALMLCSNPHNDGRDPLLKSNLDYFVDFQEFIRKALQTRDYQKLIAYPTKMTKQSQCLVNLLHSLCQSYFIAINGYRVLLPNILNKLQEARKEAKGNKNHKQGNELSELLSQDYHLLSKLMKRHASGPLVKVLDILEEGNYHAFDPFILGNIPNQLFSLEAFGRNIPIIRMPCPIHQEFIHKASITEEFKAFLRSFGKEKKFLYINFQDRTSWKDHSRCTALEDLQKHLDFSNQLIVVTMTKETEFYHQEAPYNKENQASNFIKAFKKQLEDESCGYYFPDAIRKKLFPHFINKLLNQIHHTFFKGRNVLPLERRKDFIEIAYLFIELKIIEIVQPNALTLSCKDGVDQSPVSNALMYVFLNWIQNKWNAQDQEKLDLMLFSPAIVIRERILLNDKFDRFISVLKEIELIRNEQGNEKFSKLILDAFSPLYETDILESEAQ